MQDRENFSKDLFKYTGNTNNTDSDDDFEIPPLPRRKKIKQTPATSTKANTKPNDASENNQMVPVKNQLQNVIFDNFDDINTLTHY